MVFRARQAGLDREVAVKLMREARLANAEDVRRFRAEAAAAAKLRHLHIVAIHEVGEQGGQHYFAMDLIEDTNLADRTREGPLSAREAARVMATIADAVQHAHEQGVLHRDLKPSNVLVDAEGNPFVTDFGLTRRLDTDRNLTVTGQVLGTPGYMSPEQATGSDSLGPAADIYSLGALLYHLLTGRAPFVGGSSVETLRHVLDQEPVSPLLLNPEVARDLASICLRCLAKSPAHRYPSAKLLALDLERFLRSEPTWARPVGPLERLWRFCGRKPALAGFAGATAVLVLVVAMASPIVALRMNQSRKMAEAARASETQERVAAQAAQHQADRERARAEARETSEQSLRYIASMNLIQQAWEANDVERVQKLLEETAAYPGRGFEWYYWQQQTHLEVRRFIGHTEPIWSAAFSPDGQRIVTTSGTMGSRSSATGVPDSAARVWDAVSGKGGAAFSPDGRRIVTGGSDRVARVWDAANGQQLLILKGHSEGIESVAFSPDGTRVLTASDDRTAKIWKVDAGPAPALPPEQTAEAQCVAVSPDGRRMITGTSTLPAKLLEVATGKELLQFTGHEGPIKAAAFSPDGERIVTGSVDQTAKVWSVATGTERITLRGHSGWVRAVCFSSDGRRIATGSVDRSARIWDAVSGHELLRLKGHRGPILSVAFSPDGRQLATGSADNTTKIWDAFDGQERSALRGHKGPIPAVAFAPDGDRIVTAGLDGTVRIWETATGRKLFTLVGHAGDVFSVAFCSDARRILSTGGDQTARLWDATTDRELVSLKGWGTPILCASFSPDGQRIVAGGKDQRDKVWEAATSEQVIAWRRADADQAARLVALQRATVAAAESERALRAQDPGAIRQWLMLAPIPVDAHDPAKQEADLDQEQVPQEAHLRPHEGDRAAVSAGERFWTRVALDDIPIDFNQFLGEVTEQAVAYAVCYVESDADRSFLVVKVGNDDSAKVYLNGRQVYRDAFGGPFAPDRHEVSGIELKAGLNTVVFKV